MVQNIRSSDKCLLAGRFFKKYISCTEFMITQKNRLEPTLILQSVDDVTNCKKKSKRETLFSVNPTQIESRDQKNSRDQGSKFKA